MKSTDIFEAIGGAKEKYLAASEKFRKSFSRYAGWIACAACLCIAVICFTLFRPQTPSEIVNPSVTVQTPSTKLNSSDIFAIDAMGYEAYKAYNISQVKSGSPGAECDTPETLPIFSNRSYNPYISSYGLSETKMLSIVYDVLDFFEIEIYSKTFTGIKKHFFSDSNRDPRGFLIPDNTITRIELTVEFGKIEVDASGTVTIQFDKAPAFSDEYNMNTNPEETLLHSAEMFKGLLKFEKPSIAVQESYNNLGELTRKYKVYDSAGDITEQLLNFTCEYAEFIFDSDGYMTKLRIYNNLSIAEELGHYPTISSEEAKALLIDGKYYSSYMENSFPGEEYIARVELSYRTSHLEKIWVPYYKFYVELPEKEKEDGLKTYAAYYVPAIDPEYIVSYPPSNIDFTDKPVNYGSNAPTDFPELS